MNRPRNCITSHRKSRGDLTKEEILVEQMAAHVAKTLTAQCLHETLGRVNTLEAKVAAAVQRVDAGLGPPLLEFGSDCTAVLKAAETAVKARSRNIVASLNMSFALNSTGDTGGNAGLGNVSFSTDQTSSKKPKAARDDKKVMMIKAQAVALQSLRRQLVTAMEPILRRHLQALLRYSLQHFEDDFASLMAGISDGFDQRAKDMRREALGIFRAGARAAIPDELQSQEKDEGQYGDEDEDEDDTNFGGRKRRGAGLGPLFDGNRVSWPVLRQYLINIGRHLATIWRRMVARTKVVGRTVARAVRRRFGCLRLRKLLPGARGASKSNMNEVRTRQSDGWGSVHTARWSAQREYLDLKESLDELIANRRAETKMNFDEDDEQENPGKTLRKRILSQLIVFAIKWIQGMHTLLAARREAVRQEKAMPVFPAF